MQSNRGASQSRFGRSNSSHNSGQRKSFYYGPKVGGDRTDSLNNSDSRRFSGNSGRDFATSPRSEGERRGNSYRDNRGAAPLQMNRKSLSRFNDRNSGSDRPDSGYRSQGSSSMGGRDSFRSSDYGRRSGGRSGGQGGSRSGGRNKRNFSENIDVSRFVKKSTFVPEDKLPAPTNSFLDFNFSDEIKNNLKHKGYITPTPIQDQSINHILDGKDLIGLANTGTGKTAAFLLPLIDKVFKNKSEKVLILAPTRELAVQIDDEFRQFSWNMKIFSAVCVGGMPIYKQINNLKRSPNFIIGTPGRMKDLADRGVIKYSEFKNVVIDEIDRMLDMGFVNEIKSIMSELPKDRQSLFFSATMVPKIKDIVEQFSNNPVTVQVTTGETAGNVDQDIVRVRDRAIKFTQLKELLSEPALSKVLIFSETKMDVERLSEDLKKEGFLADSIHGDKKQHQRQTALGRFKNNSIKILVATDVAARGIDVKDISHVINYTVPQTYTDYIHRIGRTGRGNCKGYALTFVEGR